MSGLRTVEEHLASILAHAHPLDAVVRPTHDAVGHTLARDATARVDIPVFDNSAMDGFAVRWEDVARATADAPVTLRVVADLPAGSGDDPPIGPGEAVRIMTGSAVPSDADVIVPFESTRGGLADSLGDIAVTIAPADRGTHIRPRGQDLRAGDIALAAGAPIGPLHSGALQAAGIAAVDVFRRPRVAIVSTGSELARPGDALTRGMIPESNSTLLATLAAAENAEVVATVTVADDAALLRSAIESARAAGADVVVFSGGVSEGAYEVVKSALGPSDGTGEMTFTRVAMQPGKPQGFGLVGETLLFGLPGNPVSAAVSFEVLVRPALWRMSGRVDLDRPALRLPARSGWRTPPGRRQYLPATIDRSNPAAWTIGPATSGGSGSHLAGGLGRAEAYAVVPAEVEAVEPGMVLDVLLLPAP